VCKQLHEFVQGYDRFKIEFNVHSQFELETISRFIQPESIISLTISCKATKSNLIQKCFSLFTLNQMTRLRSIYLYYNNNEELKSLLHHIPHNASYLLSIKSEGTEYRQVSSDIVSSLLTKYSFEKLHLHNDVKYDGHRRQEKFWPAQCKLKSLLISGCTIDEYYVILQELPYLKTLVIQKWAKPGRDESLTTPQILNSSLTSLTFNKCSLRFSHVVPLLSFTRELTHLKLICDSKKFDGLFDGQY
jgi:hypothetical protein